jgi:hypothetical protein
MLDITSEIPLFAGQAVNPGIYRQIGPAVNLLNRRLAKTPSFVQKSDTKRVLFQGRKFEPVERLTISVNITGQKLVKL